MVNAATHTSLWFTSTQINSLRRLLKCCLEFESCKIISRTSRAFLEKHLFGTLDKKPAGPSAPFIATVTYIFVNNNRQQRGRAFLRRFLISITADTHTYTSVRWQIRTQVQRRSGGSGWQFHQGIPFIALDRFGDIFTLGERVPTVELNARGRAFPHDDPGPFALIIYFVA